MNEVEKKNKKKKEKKKKKKKKKKGAGKKEGRALMAETGTNYTPTWMRPPP